MFVDEAVRGVASRPWAAASVAATGGGEARKAAGPPADVRHRQRHGHLVFLAPIAAPKPVEECLVTAQVSAQR